MKRPWVVWPVRVLLFLLIYNALFALVGRLSVRPVPSDPGRYLVPAFTGEPWSGGGLPPARIAQHPFMAPSGRSNMHGDSFISATYEAMGPSGIDLQVNSTAQSRFIGGQCASVTFDSQGRIVTYCSGLAETALKLLDPHTLAELARYRLPQRGVNRTLNLRRIVKDTSGGAYFYLDHLDRAVLALPDNTIKLIRVRDDQAGPEFVLEKEYDLSPVLGSDEAKITAVLPDWHGLYWFVTRSGTIGTVDPVSGRIESIDLPGEELQNSFAVDQQAVFILSDHALYALDAEHATGKPEIIWREEYDRGNRIKPGMINQGSGTTPTLLGDGLIAIGDNAEPQMNVLIYRRERAFEGDRLVCQQPVFSPGRSATENSLIGYRDSVIVENNYGYDLFATMVLGRTAEPGLARVDLDGGGEGCHIVWESEEAAQTVVPKLSLGNGLVYVYTKMQQAPLWVDAFYLTAIDFESGETIFKRLAGTGLRYDNNYSPVTLGSDGTAYVGTVNGLLAIRDGPTQPWLAGWSAFLQEHSPLVGLALALQSLAAVCALDRLLSGRRRSGEP